MNDEQILQGIEHVLRNGGYDHYRDGTRWNPEDLRYNAEFFLPVVKRAVAEALDARPRPTDGNNLPGRLAVDALGYAWRVNDDGSFSMARINPDNSPIPEPVTFYEPVEEPSSHLPNCPGGGPLCECGSQPDEQTALNEVVTKVLALAQDIQGGRFGQPPAGSVIVNKLREIAVRDER